ncbi:RidA family protein [Emcibacter nanhaiensis]|uniref:RidA family protein n=1 Tax=Emcibacter nanhaiensis TaxID=1505037 RepID=A0A501PQF5_9PROT|nr:RidA family protein [Emcibacter nanhaiensis]TPD61921.1 RidA family protein [Emcibacter nanhaiensis]
MRNTLALAALLSAFTLPAVAAEVVHYPHPNPALPFAEAVEYNGVLYLSGQIGTGADGKLVAGGMAAEARQTMDNIKAVVEKHGSSMDKVIKCTVFMDDMSQWGDFNKVYVTYFPAGKLPARSALGADGLALGAALEVECLAAKN